MLALKHFLSSLNRLSKIYNNKIEQPTEQQQDIKKMSFAVAADSKADDPRLGSIITNYDETVGGNNNNNKSPTLVLLGFPCDEGVRRNGGRVGAAGGPDAVRKFAQNSSRSCLFVFDNKY